MPFLALPNSLKDKSVNFLTHLTTNIYLYFQKLEARHKKAVKWSLTISKTVLSMEVWKCLWFSGSGTGPNNQTVQGFRPAMALMALGKALSPHCSTPPRCINGSPVGCWTQL